MAYMPYNNFKGDTMTEFEVIFYEKENGDCSVEEFIAALDVKMRAKMVGCLNYWKKREISLENHIVSLLMMAYLRLDVKLAKILPEYYISFTMRER